MKIRTVVTLVGLAISFALPLGRICTVVARARPVWKLKQNRKPGPERETFQRPTFKHPTGCRLF